MHFTNACVRLCVCVCQNNGECMCEGVREVEVCGIDFCLISSYRYSCRLVKMATANAKIHVFLLRQDLTYSQGKHLSNSTPQGILA